MAYGVLAIFNNVAPGRDADFDRWFQSEHLEERLSVPGFLYGRRHQALSGASRYFNFYLTQTPEVLTSKGYLARLDDPTPMTKMIMSEVFRDMNRTACRRELRLGQMRGSMTVTARFDTPPEQAALKAVLEELVAKELVPCGEIWLSAEAPGAAVREEEKLRGGDKKIAACLMIDALHQSKAEKASRRLANEFPSAEIGVFRVLCEMGRGDL